MQIYHFAASNCPAEILYLLSTWTWKAWLFYSLCLIIPKSEALLGSLFIFLFLLILIYLVSLYVWLSLIVCQYCIWKLACRNIVDPWTTQIWTAWVHLCVDFFSLNTTYYSIIWFVEMELRLRRTDCKVISRFSTVQRVGALIPMLFKDQLQFDA